MAYNVIFGVLQALASVMTIVGAIGRFMAKKPTPAETKSRRTIPSIWTLLLGIGIGFLLIVSIAGLLIQSKTYSFNRSTKNIPFGIIKNYSFEDRTDIEHWIACPPVKGYTLKISDKQRYKGKKSLCLEGIEFGAYRWPEQQYEYAGIEVTDKNVLGSPLMASIAWVYVPGDENDEANSKITYTAYIAGYINKKDKGYISFRCPEVELKHGDWTPVFGGVANRINNDDKETIESVNHGIDEWDLNIVTNKPFHGSIYFDDIYFLTSPQ